MYKRHPRILVLLDLLRPAREALETKTALASGSLGNGPVRVLGIQVKNLGISALRVAPESHVVRGLGLRRIQNRHDSLLVHDGDRVVVRDLALQLGLAELAKACFLAAGSIQLRHHFLRLGHDR